MKGNFQDEFLFFQIVDLAKTCEPIDSSGDIISVQNRIAGIMVNVLVLRAVGIGFEHRSSLTIDYKIGMCCFFVRYATLRRKNKDWLIRNQDNVSEWSNVYPRSVVSVI